MINDTLDVLQFLDPTDHTSEKIGIHPFHLLEVFQVLIHHVIIHPYDAYC